MPGAETQYELHSKLQTLCVADGVRTYSSFAPRFITGFALGICECNLPFADELGMSECGMDLEQTGPPR